MPLRTGKGNMECPLTEIMVDLGLVGIAESHSSHAREDPAQLDFTNTVEIDPSRRQAT